MTMSAADSMFGLPDRTLHDPASAFPHFEFANDVHGRAGRRWAAVRKDGCQPGLYAFITDDPGELREVLAADGDRARKNMPEPAALPGYAAMNREYDPRERSIAQFLQYRNQAWLIMYGPWSRLYWAYSIFATRSGRAIMLISQQARDLEVLIRNAETIE